jgi:hypothetical protein
LGWWGQENFRKDLEEDGEAKEEEIKRIVRNYLLIK